MQNRILVSSGVILALSFGLAWISTGFESLQGWGSFLTVLILGAGILFGGWQALRRESVPRWVGWLLISAVILRLGVGILWSITLPRWGYGTDGELAGYVMSDAYRRDTTAWELSQSEAPLSSAFQDYRLADQYGGLLFLSAAVYRYLGGDTHQPLMIVVLAAAFSGLAVIFTWAFTRRLWGKATARVAAWILALYPEAVLLGSSQMREAFTMTLAAIALYGLVFYWQDRRWEAAVWVLAALALGVPLSSMFAILLAGILVVMALILDRGRILRHWQLWAVLGCLLVIGVAGLWFLGDQVFLEGAANPWNSISQWLKYAAKWEARNAILSSGWIKKIFNRSPDWMNGWIILGYGTVQPFLPAALIASGNWLWRIIALWRAFGWTLLLLSLVVAPLRAGQKMWERFIPGGISFLVWASILLSAYRGGGDQWDNPRYRVTFVALQVALAAWVWVEQQREPDPWLRRVLVGTGLVFAWFIPWYVRRYIPQITWPVIDLFKTVGLGFVSAVLYGVWDAVRSETGG